MMSYNVDIKRAASNKMKSLPRHERKRITDKIQELIINPDSKELDIKQMEGMKDTLYRLRVGGWRILFTRNDISKTITIKEIGSRGDIYK